MDFTDLKSALAYSMKFESAKTASKISIHAGSMKTDDDTWKERYDKFESLLKALEKKLTCGRLAEQKIPTLNKSPEEGLKVSTLSGGGNGLYLKGSICDIPCLFLVDTSTNITLLRADLAHKVKERLIYTAPNLTLKTATGEKAKIQGRLDASIECGSRKFQHRVYVADITDSCILGLDFLQKFKFTVDLEKNEIRTGLEKISLFSGSTQHRKRTYDGKNVQSRRLCFEGCEPCSNAEKKFRTETDISVEALTMATGNRWSLSEIQKAQLEDPDIRPILKMKLNSADRPSWQEIAHESPATKRYWALWDSLHLKDCVLYRKWESDDGNSCRWQLILPKSRIPEVLREIHDSASGGHFGVMKTLSKTRERFYWDRLRAVVENWCRECHDCGARKGHKTRTKGRLQSYNVGTPFERMALDILGPFPVTTKGNRYVLVLMDYFTKWPEAIPIPDQEASTVAEELVRSWISCYGVPMILHSDQGTNFNSALFTKLCKLLGILKTRTIALHPESDGMGERFNRTILNHLSLFVSRNQTDRDTHLPLFLLAYRSAEHEVTGLTPAEMLFGRTLRFPCDILFGRPSETPSSPNEYMKNLEARLESIHAFARERIKLASERMKTRYDSRATHYHFKEGHLVWMYNPKRRRGLSPKLQQNWEGPYTVVKKLNNVVYRVQRSPNAKPKVIHINRPAPYRATDHNSM
ncbi:Retrovirus-related Pol polyprotein from transposon 412 [Araneus ventricosus]|uniref:RNA-directed DNA polymerase n=1 Tax=Araneus ventricosus TaxID=182803 RepID=A0A4Y2HXS2_ARAVE|nr:Retrovirus-related Pol polyprotein from transposon 412 [Araneus ventricosus]